MHFFGLRDEVKRTWIFSPVQFGPGAASVVFKHPDRHIKNTLTKQHTRAVILSSCGHTMNCWKSESASQSQSQEERRASRSLRENEKNNKKKSTEPRDMQFCLLV